MPSSLTAKRPKATADTKHKAKALQKITPSTPSVTSANPPIDPMAQALAWLLKDYSLTEAQAFNQTELQEALSEAVIDYALINTLKSDAFKNAHQACHPHSEPAATFDPQQSIHHYAKQAQLTSAHLRQQVQKTVCGSQGASSSAPKRTKLQASESLSTSLQTALARPAAS